MAQGRFNWSEARIERLFKEGRGQGTGANYKPFIEITDFSSRGRSRRIYSQKTGRVHHLFSDVEFEFFLMLQWSRDVIDIREQYPLDRDLTRTLAMEIGIRHPCYPGTNIPTVMTTDFLVTRVRDGKTILEAFDTKCTEDAEDYRTIEKLELARNALELLEIPHHLIYHSELPLGKIRNLEWIAGAQSMKGQEDPSGYLEEHCQRLLLSLSNANKRTPLYEHCEAYDTACGLVRGSGLRFARILMRQRALTPNLSCADLASAPLAEFQTSAQPGQLRAVGDMR